MLTARQGRGVEPAGGHWQGCGVGGRSTEGARVELIPSCLLRTDQEEVHRHSRGQTLSQARRGDNRVPPMPPATSQRHKENSKSLLQEFLGNSSKKKKTHQRENNNNKTRQHTHSHTERCGALARGGVRTRSPKLLLGSLSGWWGQSGTGGPLGTCRGPVPAPCFQTWSVCHVGPWSKERPERTRVLVLHPIPHRVWSPQSHLRPPGCPHCLQI